MLLTISSFVPGINKHTCSNVTADKHMVLRDKEELSEMFSLIECDQLVGA